MTIPLQKDEIICYGSHVKSRDTEKTKTLDKLTKILEWTLTFIVQTEIQIQEVVPKEKRIGETDWTTKSDNKIYGVLPNIAPEVLNGEPYALSSDIYSFGIVMVELSSGKPPFHERKHDNSLALEICNGLRPEFGKGTPEIYKKLAHRCMNANPNQRPTASELREILNFWRGNNGDEKYGYKLEEVKVAFKVADKEIPNKSTSYEKDSDAIYTKDNEVC
ncbi:kinase-like domain-containing protein [Rhizophagus clarus]|uniref:Kinase-like domain-containing protein n=1 Tax=Rhizophagus clarus TaxID=94130 RepID=A0A8H3QPT0_9GLOM|nr:kinase-like domain-containing protein [Rhizophagus clarus]